MVISPKDGSRSKSERGETGRLKSPSGGANRARHDPRARELAQHGQNQRVGVNQIFCTALTLLALGLHTQSRGVARYTRFDLQARRSPQVLLHRSL
jgi:hypothetical protein